MTWHLVNQKSALVQAMICRQKASTHCMNQRWRWNMFILMSKSHSYSCFSRSFDEFHTLKGKWFLFQIMSFHRLFTDVSTSHNISTIAIILHIPSAITKHGQCRFPRLVPFGIHHVIAINMDPCEWVYMQTFTSLWIFAFRYSWKITPFVFQYFLRCIVNFVCIGVVSMQYKLFANDGSSYWDCFNVALSITTQTNRFGRIWTHDTGIPMKKMT